MMLLQRITFCVLFLFCYEIPTMVRGEEMIQLLRKKMTGLEDSLSTDIKFLRQDIKRNSDEFLRLSNLLGDALAALDGNPELNREGNKELESQTKQTEITQGIELANRRLKRAFAEEKAVLRKVTSRVKSEIDHLAKGIRDALGEFKVSHVKANNEFGENFDSFQNDITQGLNHVITDLGTNVTKSVEAMSRDIAKDTNKTVSTVESMSENFGMVSDIKNTVDDTSSRLNELSHTMVSDIKNTVDDTSSRLNELSNKIDPFTAKFNDISVMLDKLKMDIGTILEVQAKMTVGNDRVRLVNVSRTVNTIEGRLEVFANNAWGSVCDDGFDTNDAAVACMMLAFSKAHSFQREAFYGKGRGPIWLESLKCSGSESSLFDCPHDGIGKHDCSHSEDIGVRCHY